LAAASITIGSVIAQVVSMTNIDAIISVPASSSVSTETVQISFKTQTATGAFTYGAPTTVTTITAISPVSASPVLKAIMNITGSGFGTNASLVQVYLSNGTGNIYPMRILSITDTFIQCGIPGGLPGQFQVNVNTTDGYALISPTGANNFVYEVVITSVSPSTGSVYGGTLLTIQGRNFVADPAQSLVFIGNALNQFCYVETITSSSITCRTIIRDSIDASYVNKSVPITLTSRLIIDNTCENSACHFEYIDSSVSPYIYNISAKSITILTNSLLLTGSRFNIGTSCMVALTNTVTNVVIIVTPNSFTESSINFTVPNTVEAGTY
jgi:hypothetical protein